MRALIVILALAAGLAEAQDGSGRFSRFGPSGSPVLGGLTVGSIDAGVIYVSDGTAALPAYSWWSDPDTGFYSISSGKVGFVRDGVESFRFGVAAGYISGVSEAAAVGLTASTAVLAFGGGALTVTGSQTSTTNTGGFDISTADAPLKFGGVPVLASTTPTIGSGFGTSPSVTAGKAYAFRVNVGTGGTASTGVIALGTTATNGWNCTCADLTTQSATVFLCKQTASSTTTATIGNFNTAGAAAAWVASDILAVSCTAF